MVWGDDVKFVKEKVRVVGETPVGISKAVAENLLAEDRRGCTDWLEHVSMSHETVAADT
jgi:hypothetical protein